MMVVATNPRKTKVVEESLLQPQTVPVCNAWPEQHDFW
jgi:hypothetical protein